MFYSNQPSEADSISLISNPGDVIVMGTDGLFDNMFDSQIVDVVNRSFERERLSSLAGKSSAALSGDIWIPEQSHCRKVAEDVVLKAKENSLNTRWYSPYAQKARAAGDLKTGLGGKTVS
jgi:serine/threonine protein phosphatase PrpC